MTHAELVLIAARWLRKRRCVLVLTEAQGWSTREFPDAIGWDTHGRSTLIECKASKSDFKADASKPFRQDPTQGMGRRRYYLTPPYLVTAIELPERWGLLEAVGGKVHVMRKSEAFEGAAHAAAEAPLLVRTVRAVGAHWSGHERTWFDKGNRSDCKCVLCVSV